MGTLFNNLDLKALGYDGSYERLVAEVGEIVSKDDNEELFFQLLTERVCLDFTVGPRKIGNGLKARKKREAFLNSWRISARARARRVLPFLKGAAIPRKKRSLEVDYTSYKRKSEDNWFNQFLKPQFLADWSEEKPGIKLPIAQQEGDKPMNGKETRALTKNGSKKRCFEGENREEQIKKARKQKVSKNNNIDLDKFPTELPAGLRKIIADEKGGSDPVLVITKVLYATDTSTHHGRFSMPTKQIRNNFLTDEEKAKLDSSKGIAASLIEPCGHENHLIRLTRWNMSTNAVYNLTSGWNSVINNNENGLKGMENRAVVQLWSFRLNTQLWFALVKVPDRDLDDNGTIEGS